MIKLWIFFVFAYFFLMSICYAQKSILLPKEPKKRSIIYDNEIDTKALKERRKEKEKTFQIKPSEQLSDESKEKDPIIHQASPSPILKDQNPIIYHHGFLIAMTASLFKSSLSKQNFQSDPSFCFTYLKEITESRKDTMKNSSIWMGFKIANASGLSTSNDISVRYSYTYMGPFLATGQMIYPEEKPFSRINGLNDEEALEVKKPVYGYFLLSGISFVTKKIDTDPSLNHLPKDLETSKTFNFTDAVFWFEGIWIDFKKEGSLSIYYSLGAQKGIGSSWFWAGVGVGGWM